MSRTARTASLSKSLHARRRAFERQTLGVPGLSAMLGALAQPSLGLGLVVAGVFALACTLLAGWAREQPLVAVGRVMSETRLVRVDGLEVHDEALTRQKREMARESTPRVYVADRPVLEGLISSIARLPEALAGVTSLEAVDAGLRERFALADESLLAVMGIAAREDGRREWAIATQQLADLLCVQPILDGATYQRAQNEGTHQRVRVVVGEQSRPVLRRELVSIEDKETLRRLAELLARDAGFNGPARAVVRERIVRVGAPTFTFDEAETVRAQTASAETVQPVTIVSPRRQVIFERGEELSPAQAQMFRAELEAFSNGQPFWARVVRWVSLAGACGGISCALAGYAVLFAPRIRRRTSRMIGVAAVLLAMLALACAGTVLKPELVGAATVLPTAMVAVLICIGYDRRTALAFGLLHGLLVCLSLRQSIAVMATIVTGVAFVVTTLREVRDRKSLVRCGVLTGAGLAAATIVFGLIDRPIDWESVRELLLDAGLAGAGMLIVSGLTLFVLPVIERAFNVTTGMTLTELRDPKQPLLRELQLRAPGTYTHSLNVASIAESAAEAIGCDSLLTYVGAMYHDVGKMNKPEYFVENQTGGPNRHDRLSPAMSLLIVVGHVKDGVELAREFRLPPRIQHFIEAHHGTTLVEFFYHRARTIALASPDRDREGEPDMNVPDEFEYRYTGPKPRTKEVAIVMIADAVESAARAMGEPTPARIETLTREIANKRLLDGQFDDCELTMSDLSKIVDSIARTVTSMYHGRVPYPTGRAEAESPTQLMTGPAGKAAAMAGT